MLMRVTGHRTCPILRFAAGAVAIAGLALSALAACSEESVDRGAADFWVDGVRHGSFGGFQWRTVDALQANTFALDSYNHVNNGAPPSASPNLVRYDNLVLSRVPVGCLTGS